MSQNDILAKLSKGEITADEASQLLDKANERPITFKVSAKGAVSAYGLYRMPTTLYAAQWLRLLDKADELRKFIADHEHQLASKKVA